MLGTDANESSAKLDGRVDGTANANEFFSRLVTQLTEGLVPRGADLATTRDLPASPARRNLATSYRI